VRGPRTAKTAKSAVDKGGDGMETFVVSGNYEIYPPPHGIGHLETFSFRIAAGTDDEAKRIAETRLAGEVAGWAENEASVCSILVTSLEREFPIRKETA